MQCPKCHAAMQKVEYQQVEVDRCSACQGLWFDLLEHEELAALDGAEAIDSGAVEVGRRSDQIDRIQCPACHVPMIRMVVSGQPHIRYESCTVCYGVYFDAGEFTDFRTVTLGESLRDLLRRLRS
jgi:uncharacterized protein